MNRALPILLLVLAVLPACRRPMVVPTIFEDAAVDALADEPAREANPMRSLFYVTDRVGDEADGDIRYTRQRNGAMEAGRINIQFGDDLTWQMVQDAVNGKDGDRLPRPTMTGIERFGMLSSAGMHPHVPIHQQTAEDAKPSPAATVLIEQLNEAIKQSTGKAITIYIHGFNNSFKQAALTAAEYELLTGGLGPFILYSWPSYESLWEYSHDRDSVRFTSGHARQLLEFFAQEMAAGRLEAEQIHFIAHSSGAEIIGSVLRELSLLSRELSPQQKQRQWRIGQVLLVSPDVSADVARERVLKEDLRGVFRQMVVYSSSKDRALRWASHILYRTPRIGSITEEDLTEEDRHWLKMTDRVAIVDVDSRSYGGIVHHSHQRFSPEVASDMILSLRTPLKPNERGLIRGDDQVLWRFPDHYDTLATEAAKAAYGQGQSP